MSKLGSAIPMVLPLNAWPDCDHALWEQGTAPVTGLHRRRHAETLRPITIAHARKSYGRLLSVLAERDALDPAIGPAERVTHEAVAIFFDALRDAGNADSTIKVRLFNLRIALRIMVPKAEFGWITRPGGFSLDAVLPTAPRDDLHVPEAVRLFRWGLGMTVGDLPAAPAARLSFCRLYRDGLLIALFACRAPRLGSVAAMLLGINLERRGPEYWVQLQSMIVKNRRILEYSLPAELTPVIDRYLAEIRPCLLDPTATDAVWGNGDGLAFTYGAIQTMIRRRSARDFPEAFGPHRFRHSFASTLASADPSNPGLAAVILGIGEQVVHEHYRKARQRDAASKLGQHLATERERTRVTADRAFEAVR